MKRVLVMLSTYNGEKYVEEQIESVLKQEGVEVYLNIRDDGSEDKTCEILEKYRKYDNVDLQFGENIGYAYSFWQILLHSDKYEYYAFCDQDDVWKKHKLNNAIKELEKIPCSNKFYCSSLTVVDENLKYLYINRYKNLNLSLGSSIVRQRIAGCTMVFDNCLKELLLNCRLQEERIVMSHDMAVYAVCCLTGGVPVYADRPDILYRRHQEAITSRGKGVLVRIKTYLKIFEEDRGRKYKELEYLKKKLDGKIELQQNVLLEKVLNYKRSFASTMALFWEPEIDSKVFLLNAIVKVAILT